MFRKIIFQIMNNYPISPRLWGQSSCSSFIFFCFEYLKSHRYLSLKSHTYHSGRCHLPGMLRTLCSEILTTILDCAFCFLAGNMKMCFWRYIFFRERFFFSLPGNLFPSLRKFLHFYDTRNLCLLFALLCWDQNSWFVLICLGFSSPFD